jgi:hypothetical protein
MDAGVIIPPPTPKQAPSVLIKITPLQTKKLWAIDFRKLGQSSWSWNNDEKKKYTQNLMNSEKELETLETNQITM